MGPRDLLPSVLHRLSNPAARLVLRPALRAALRMPEPALRAFAGPPLRADTGAELDLQTQVLLRGQRLARREITWERTTAQRARWDMEADAGLGNAAPTALHEVEDRHIPTRAGPRPARLYRPRLGGDLPVLVWFHGGGWVVGSLDTHDPICRRLADTGECLVVSVDYRLAPEHPFPAAVEDALDTFSWVRANAAGLGGDPARVAVGGDSAGGNLSAVVSRILAEEAPDRAPALQVLVYPATDLTRAQASHRLFAHGYLLDQPTIGWLLAQYLPDRSLETDPRASPLLTPPPSGLPPALIVTGDFDPLRDEGRAYAEALSGAGGSVSELRYPGLVHGFLSLAGLVQAAQAALDEIGREVGRELRSR